MKRQLQWRRELEEICISSDHHSKARVTPIRQGSACKNKQLSPSIVAFIFEDLLRLYTRNEMYMASEITAADGTRQVAD